jgi:hypothetical protein
MKLVQVLFLALAALAFALAALEVKSPYVNMTALGLFFLALSMLVPAL